MFNSGAKLTSNNQFVSAMNHNFLVEVWRRGQFLYQVGKIDSFTDAKVNINGRTFLRMLFEFKVR